ncbi:MAG TPA: phytanoyl-CoA dioxygenase family protein, partial [Tepidisphaeraceae bacterium]|nr:phytanoyl-CoA dioxygenase family protein [Tepidisphaeraceae bacterium]
MRISDDQIAHYLEHGYVLVPNFLAPAELASARAAFGEHFPSYEDLRANPEEHEELLEEPEHLQAEFPFAQPALNDVSTHPALIAFVERILGVRDVLLSQSAIWAKYAGTAGSYDQGMHLDYRGNTLVVPRDEGPFRQVNMILYYTDVTPDLGPTCVVSTKETADLPVWPPFKPRKQHPRLYEREVKLLASAGSLFVFAMGTYHRASEITAAHGCRFSHHLVWRSAAYPFAGYHQWSQFGENP